MPLANYSRSILSLCFIASPSKRARKLQPNNYIEYIFSTRGKGIKKCFADCDLQCMIFSECSRHLKASQACISQLKYFSFTMY